MFEVAFSGEDHGDVVLVGGGDDVCVADAAAWFDHCGDAGDGNRIETVAEREVGVTGADSGDGSSG